MNATRSLGKLRAGAILLLLCSGCALQTWQSLQSDRFACHVEEDLDSGLVSRLTAWTEEDLVAVAELLQLPLPDRSVDVYCGHPTHQGGRLRTLRGEVGRYQTRTHGHGRIELVANSNPAEMRSTLRHELAHHIMQEEGYAEWLNEGLAEYAAYTLAAPASEDDLHHLLHAGIVVAGWSDGLLIETPGGEVRSFTPELWLPDLPSVLRMNYEEYAQQVLHRHGEQLQPEFHSVAHLLTRVLLQRCGPEGPWRYTLKIRSEVDPWEAYLNTTGLESETAVLAALTDSLGKAVTEMPIGEWVAADFAHSRCMEKILPDELRVAIGTGCHIQAYPGGPLFASKSSSPPLAATRNEPSQ